jgi:hypothetical protein
MMFIFRFKKLFFLCLLTLFSFSLKAQQAHFVYLQTDNGQPFYVKLDSKVVSSSAEGYLILPGLSDGVYKIAVGFPKKEHPEENFTFNIDNNNEGFLIKNFEEKGLQLFNLETLALINGTANSSNTIATTVKKDIDPFSKMLADVVKDSSILQNHQIEVPKPVTAPVDSQVTTNNDVASVPVPDADTFSVAKIDSPVSKLLSRQDTNGLQMVYADKNNEKTDTVRVFIPSPDEQIAATENNRVAGNKNAGISSFTDSVKFTITPTVIKPQKDTSGFVFRKDSLAVDKDSNTSPEQVFVIGPAKKKDPAVKEPEHKGTPQDMDQATDTEISDTNQQKKNKEAAASQVILLPKVVTSSTVNSDCKAFASSEDFLRLRKKMAAESNGENMIKVAKKYFKTKCFSTDQIKDLSYLFLTDEGRYKFFDAAYAHTSDSDQYQVLESQLTDEYYLNRFKAMIRK